MRRIVTTCVLAVAFAACGGEDPLSTEDYRAELRKICAESERKTSQVDEPTRSTPESIANYLGRLRDINVETIEKVEGLEPPEELEEAHERGLEANREGRQRVEKVIDELEKGGDPVQVLTDARQGLEESRREAQQAGRDLGVPDCAD
jgi:hypothetical protein